MSLRKYAFRGSIAAVGTVGGFFLYRAAYVNIYPPHVLQLRHTYFIGLPSWQLFLLQSDPTLLDTSTPWWFHLVPDDMSALQRFTTVFRLMNWDWLYEMRQDPNNLEKAEPALDVTDVPDVESPVDLSYTLNFFQLFPIPWTSRVELAGKVLSPTFYEKVQPFEKDHHHYWIDLEKKRHPINLQANIVDVNRVDALTENVYATPLLPETRWKYYFRMGYKQLRGPYAVFNHTHMIIREKKGDLPVGVQDGANSGIDFSDNPHNPWSRVEDVIRFSVCGEPVLNYCCLVLLRKIMQARYEYFSEEFDGCFGGEEVVVG